MESEERSVGEIKANLLEKIKLAKAKLSPDKNMLDVYVEAELSDDELWVLAHSKVNNDRTNMEWEGFYISDIKAHENVKRRFESLQQRINDHK